MKQRIILHVDMDAFFAAIEVVHNPSLRGKEVVIGGDPAKRGVVSTCSYEARKYGIHSAMSLAEAKKRCPHAIFLRGNFSLYREASEKIMEIFYSFTPYVQPMSIDEAYLDVSEVLSLSVDPVDLAKTIHHTIYQKTNLTCSVGIASNKMMAKIASGHCKPNGLCRIPLGRESSFLSPLSVSVIPGIGKQSELYLREKGFRTVGDLQKLEFAQFIEYFGRSGYDLFQSAFGKDDRPVRWWAREPKSIGEETTFPKDTNDSHFLQETLHELVEDVAARLKRKGMRTRGITVKIRDHRFRTTTHSRTLLTHTQSEKLLQEEVCKLFDLVYPSGMWVRLIGVTLEKLAKDEWQPTLWDWERDERRLAGMPSE